MTRNFFNLANMGPEQHNPHVMTRMTVVRIAVAQSEFISFTPILVKMAVMAAKRADSRAYNFHMTQLSLFAMLN